MDKADLKIRAMIMSHTVGCIKKNGKRTHILVDGGEKIKTAIPHRNHLDYVPVVYAYSVL